MRFLPVTVYVLKGPGAGGAAVDEAHLAAMLDHAKDFYEAKDISLWRLQTSAPFAGAPNGELRMSNSGPLLARSSVGKAKGVDVYVLPLLERIEQHRPFGVTVLPGKTPPDGFPQNAVNNKPEPNPVRPVIFLNGESAVPITTLTHELGHALLNDSAHSMEAGNFMLAENQGIDCTRAQQDKMRGSPWLE